MAAKEGGKKSKKIDEQLRGSHVGIEVQVSMSFSASSFCDVTAGGLKDNVLGLGP